MMNEGEVVADRILEEIDRETGYTVPELADRLGVGELEVQGGLEVLMERGAITSTPDWKYREARRVEE